MTRFSIALAALLLATPAAAGDVITGPVSAEVVSIYDGDTLTVQANPWPSVYIRTSVRILGVDAPEIRGKCEAEKAAAIAARDRLAGLVAGKTVSLVNVEPDKYGGRVDAMVLVDGSNVADTLIAEGHGRPYHGERRKGWCE